MAILIRRQDGNLRTTTEYLGRRCRTLDLVKPIQRCKAVNTSMVSYPFDGSQVRNSQSRFAPCCNGRGQIVYGSQSFYK